MKRLSERIREKAAELGIDKVGIAPADRLDVEADHLAAWLNRGYHGTMAWMSRNFDKRSDPRKILPGAKSVVAVALNYYTDTPHSDNEGTGKISRYAWGDDYHDVLTPKLERLLEFIENAVPGCEGNAYVDTGPVMEKAWAERSGIGWLGKHTNVITKESGSWVFLGEIIVNVELDYDDPATDHCGDCTLCIEACPTQAIVEPYVLDSTRCISYWTIEHRGAVAKSLSGTFNRWVYGCDVCQDVCPWNTKFARQTSLSEFFPREHNVSPDLRSLSEMSRGEFNARYRNSPIKRTRLHGLVRNAKFLLGLFFTI